MVFIVKLITFERNSRRVSWTPVLHLIDGYGQSSFSSGFFYIPCWCFIEVFIADIGLSRLDALELGSVYLGTSAFLFLHLCQLEFFQLLEHDCDGVLAMFVIWWNCFSQLKQFISSSIKLICTIIIISLQIFP